MRANLTSLLRPHLLVAAIAVAGVPLSAAGQTMSLGQRSPFEGSVPTGPVSTTPLTLTLRDAIERGLVANLGAIERAESIRSARAQWLTSLSNLLPNVVARISSTREEVAAASLGFSNVAGFTIPKVIGPFAYVDARVFLSQRVFNWADIKGVKSASAARDASEHSYRAARELVVQATANAYLVANADQALVDSTRTQVETARALHQQVSDRNKSGLVASIDVLRARVQLQTEQQRLIVAENQLAIDKLALARVIGLPPGQAFIVADAVPYTELGELGLDDALARGRASRPDYQAAQARVRAAEFARQSAMAGNYPSVSIDMNYGDIGTTFGQSNGTFAFAANVAIPIFQGMTVPAQVQRSDAALREARAEFDDLTGKIDEQIRTAFLNLSSSNQLVAVARSNIDLAVQTLTQARDRFAAGVADNLEVVQAQESVATANQSFIASLYSYNSAKVALAQSLGTAEQSAMSYLGVK